MNYRIQLFCRLLFFSSFILHPSSFTWADGGAVRLSKPSGNYRLTVFTAPTPIRAGPVDISVLVQDAETGVCVPEVAVTVRLTARQTKLEYAATTAAATNKLMYAAVFRLPEPGHWNVEVTVEGARGPASVRFEMEAAEPLPRWLDLWPWFAWPAGAVALFGIHQILVRSANRRR